MKNLKKPLLFIYLVAILLVIQNPVRSFGQEEKEHGCRHPLILEKLTSLSEKQKKRIKEAEEQLEKETVEYIKKRKSGQLKAAQEFVIPVVVHVVHDDGDENIDDDQIIDAIDQMTEDYHAWPTGGAIDGYGHLMADVGITFKLAKLDPDGNPTTGITRTVNEATYDGIEGAIQNAIRWPRDMYLNIWVIYSSDGTGAGSAYSNYPTTVANGTGLEFWDGIVVSYWAVGRTGTAIDTHYKILTHEAGHWLNLKHPWGDRTDNGSEAACEDDDHVSDTPLTKGNSGCAASSSCGSADNIENFMDYGSCTTMFTYGQEARMEAALMSPIADRYNLWQESNLIATGIMEAPVRPNFSTDLKEIIPGESVNFTDKSESDNANISYWLWEFEGGTPSIYEGKYPPPVSYPINGRFDVKLTIVDHKDQRKTTIKRDHIIVSNNVIMGGNDRVITINEGTFFDSGHEGYYADYENSTITFMPAVPDSKIELIFTYLHLEHNNTNCEFDYIQVYDDSTATGNLLGTYCDENEPPDVITATNTSGALTVKFYSDDESVNDGWIASIACVGAGEKHYTMGDGSITTCEGTLYDPGKNGYYYNDEESVMTINPDESGKAIQLTFTDFAFEGDDEHCYYDWLDIYDGATSDDTWIDEWCSTVSPGIIKATNSSGALTLEMVTDDNEINRGFVADITCVDIPSDQYLMQNGTITVSNGVFFDSGGYNEYSDNESQTLTLVPEEEGKMVEVDFYQFAMESEDYHCEFDYLEIFDGADASGRFLGFFCLDFNPGIITATNPEGALSFRFTSDDNSTEQGWAAYAYQVSPKPNQNNDYLMQSGTFNVCNGRFLDGGGETRDYEPGENYTMTFLPDSGKKISVSFNVFMLETYDDECEFDNLKIYDGKNQSASLIGTYCGDQSPGSVIATNDDGALTFVFVSDANNSNPGWQAEIRCVAEDEIVMRDGSVEACSGKFWDPGYLTDYSDNSSVTMTINPSIQGENVEVAFNTFLLESSDENCEYDFLQIYDGNSAGSNLIGTYCNSQNPGIVTATNGSLTFTLTSDDYMTGIGWDANIMCPGTGHPPIVEFEAVPAIAVAGGIISFSDLSEHEPREWSWMFPGGTPSTSSDQNPVITYNETGTFDVTLVASNSFGIIPMLKTAYITVVAPPCESTSDDASYEWIAGVSIGNFTNTSEGATYSDFTSEVITMLPGTDSDVTLTPGFSSSAYTEYWNVWIDFNGNGSFEDAGESVFSENGNSDVSGTISIPSDAAGGAIMRISMRYNAAPEPCGNFTSGEVEDYAVLFSSNQALGAPGNLTYSNLTETSVDLSWSAPGDDFEATIYYIYNNGILVETSTSTNASLNGLLLGESYSFYVIALDAAENQSPKSNVVNITISDNEAPTTPTNLNASNVTQTSVDLSWNASTDNLGVTEYEVFNGTASAGTTISTSLAVTGLTSGTTFSFTVKAKDAASNESAASSTLSITTSAAADTQAPSVPTSLSSANITETSVDLSWNASTDNVAVSEYEVFEGTNSVGTSITTSLSVTSLSAGNTYSFTVKARDAAGNESAASSALSVTTTSSSCTNYCASNGNSVQYEWITDVAIASFSKSSDASSGGYADYTNETISLTPGSNVSVTLTPNNTQYNEYFKIWIDYNGNCDFDDPGEEIISGSAKGNTTGTFAVPSDANGTARLRVSMRYNNAPSSCGSHDYGEVEDYTVSFSGTKFAPLAKTTSQVIASINPNPSDGNTVVKITSAITGTGSMIIYNLKGQAIYSQNIEIASEITEIPLNIKVQPGIYTLLINLDNTTINKQFIIQ